MCSGKVGMAANILGPSLLIYRTSGIQIAPNELIGLKSPVDWKSSGLQPWITFGRASRSTLASL